jgi:hypothetical protein
VPKTKGEYEAQEVLLKLQESWLREGFLSDPDAPLGLNVHFTTINKVDGKTTIVEALEEMKRVWKADVGVVEGLELGDMIAGSGSGRGDFLSKGTRLTELNRDDKSQVL